MITRTVCDVLLFINFALTIIYYIMAFKWLDKETAKLKPYGEDEKSNYKTWEDYESDRNFIYQKNQIKVILIGLIFVIISSVTCSCDGLSSEQFVMIIILISLIGMFLLGFLFSYLICNIGIKNKLIVFNFPLGKIDRNNYKYYSKYITGFFDVRGGSTYMFGILFGAFVSVPLAQTVYTIVLLCV